MMNKENYWINFWQEYGKESANGDDQTQVLRTSQKQPISLELWDYTLRYVIDALELRASDRVLELCCGNGLFSRTIAEKSHSVMAVDVSSDLIKKLDALNIENISTVVSDIRELNFEEEKFDKVLIYAGIQYLTYPESITLFESVSRWMTKGGIFFIGDIPDINRRWDFYNTEEREAYFFKRLQQDQDIVGTWFEDKFLKKLARYSGFELSVLLPQPEEMIYSRFRYDMKVTK